MAQYSGMDRFQTGKSFAHRSAEIRTAAASVTRLFKAGGRPDPKLLDDIIEHATEMKKAVEFWNEERARELREPVKTK
ncbi:hypothetical protein SEA_WOLLYPOG_38 [Arthrobacter phage Wollypog]|uniref:Uncharacterized protein n=1 Tax=Arthrobacter phage Wollypog TaxID=2790985 RepID=A0A7T3KC81_9CAUD|nr:hypothetical protein PP291_gp38 [Arthrobacter phage Wollypog]QPX62590.1 hypothetical protein SEA_WOLLYPOG_38 [Arthrobacter phage Wollypog]